MYSASARNDKPKALPGLTGIRGIAALWVMFFHIGLGVQGWSMAPWLQQSPIIGNGFRGVDLFFILSGFIMFHAHGEDFGVLRGGVIAQFACKRISRIYPANFAVLLLILLMILAVPEYADWTRSWNQLFHAERYTSIGFLQAVTLSQRWFLPDYGYWNGVTWSLSVELVAYTTLPLLAYLLLRTRSAATCLILAFASLAAMIVLLYALGNWSGGASTRLGLLRAIGGFIAGVAMRRYVALANVGDRTPARVAVISLLAIGVLPYLPSLTVLMPFPFATLIAALSYQRGMVDAVLRSRIILFLGHISFSLYLVHAEPLAMLYWLFMSGRVAYSPLTAGFALVVYLAGVIAVATGLYYAVERPAQRLGQRMTRRMARIERHVPAPPIVALQR